MQDVRSANNMNDATQPQHFTLRTGSSTSGSPASSRASSQSGFRVQAQSNTPRFSWGLNPVALPQSQPFIDPESIKIAFRVRNTDGTNPLAPATPNPACFVQRVQVFANGQRCDDINYYGRTVAVHDLLKGREYNRNKAMEGFRRKWTTRASPARCTRAATRTCCCAPPWWASCAAGRCCRRS